MTALGVLCSFALFVCLTLLASFFLPSHLSLKHVCVQHVYVNSAVYGLTSYNGLSVSPLSVVLLICGSNGTIIMLLVYP